MKKVSKKLIEKHLEDESFINSYRVKIPFHVRIPKDMKMKEFKEYNNKLATLMAAESLKIGKRPVISELIHKIIMEAEIE